MGNWKPSFVWFSFLCILVFVETGSSTILLPSSQEKHSFGQGENAGLVPEVSPDPVKITANSRFPGPGFSWKMGLGRTKIKEGLTMRTADLQTISQLWEPGEDFEVNYGEGESGDHSLSLSATERNMISQTLTRPDVAVTLQDKMEKEKRGRRERKRTLSHHSPEHWTCAVSHYWRDLGPDHYPRHVKDALCSSDRCANGLYQCIPQKYKLKILKRFERSDVIASAEPNTELPDVLRSGWRLITEDIVHCCECGSRIF